MCSGPGLNQGETSAPTQVYFNEDNKVTPCQAYQSLLESCPDDILIYIHDDVTIHDADWIDRTLSLFNNPNCVAAGMGGAPRLGNKDLYRKPFNIWNMARGGYWSNQTDAEVHGERFDGVRRIAVMDAFFIAVRTDFLRSVGGWPVDKLSHHCLDLWLACEAARAGKEVWAAGLPVTHHGGGSSVKPVYSEAKWLQGGTLESDHRDPHVWLADSYRDVLPLEVS